MNTVFIAFIISHCIVQQEDIIHTLPFSEIPQHIYSDLYVHNVIKVFSYFWTSRLISI